MTTKEQAEKAADSLLEEPRRALDEDRKKRKDALQDAVARRNSPLIPAFVAAITVMISMQYIDSNVACVALGAAIGGLFGWAARRA